MRIVLTILLLLQLKAFSQQPSIIPFPQQYQSLNGNTPIRTYHTISVNDSSLLPEANILQLALPHTKIIPGKKGSIQLQLKQLEAPSPEAYQLQTASKQITIQAGTHHGIFNGIQTLLQLSHSENIQHCRITDWPSFAWRGYMIDVGRNYMSMESLKQQIDVMARYKLNVFHFHPTEDIAWRIAIDRYPELTDPETMLRNKGKFYSKEEIKELIEYCRERHIEFVPEIDMPGHSAAFRRAMKTDMQSDSGLAIVKNILKEFCETYDVRYIHIGADEVKITNKNFIPEVSRLLESYGKQIIGWQPGGNFTPSTIRQLWLEDNAYRKIEGPTKIIDSRHLYLNHLDPQEAVTTLFNRQLGGVEKGDSAILGATICTWHDRKVRSEDDILQMNAVYPGIISFSERSWRGGGQRGWISNISEGDSTLFRDFEKRLLTHKDSYFKNLPFPYYQQSQLKWDLYGPYNNNGNTAAVFPPETPGWDSAATLKAIGGTIVLRHWWAPLIQGAIPDPKENSTWYARTRIWSERDTVLSCRIGFYDISRSQASDPPPAGQWDSKSSQIWVNGKLITPPVWINQIGGLEIPLQNEGHAYRVPIRIVCKKGWNEVLVKAPVGSFRASNWYNPVKWMFTFIPIL